MVEQMNTLVNVVNVIYFNCKEEKLYIMTVDLSFSIYHTMYSQNIVLLHFLTISHQGINLFNALLTHVFSNVSLAHLPYIFDNNFSENGWMFSNQYSADCSLFSLINCKVLWGKWCSSLQRDIFIETALSFFPERDTP